MSVSVLVGLCAGLLQPMATASRVVMSLDGAVEIAVGEQTKMVLSEGVARHFAFKAMELYNMHITDTPDGAQRLSDTASKLVFYVCFTVRSRTQMTAMSMRSVPPSR